MIAGVLSDKYNLRFILITRITSAKMSASFIQFLLSSLTTSEFIWKYVLLYSVFRQMLPRKTVNALCTASFTSRYYKFSYRALAQKIRLSVIPY